MRRIFTFVLSVILTATLWALFASPATHAADPASWNGASIVYENNTYSATTDKETIGKLGLRNVDKAYIFVEPATTNSNPSSSNGTSPPDRKIHVIYFENSVDSATATEAKYKTLTYVGPQNFTNPSAVQTIQFNQVGAETTTSCAVDTGLGYIICPLTTTLATAMDSVYDILTGFLEVRPLETGQDSALYRAWKFMQAFANVAFVVAFLIIIYSQLTGMGIDKYGLKKILPRLIIAALLVNLSFFISAIAIDISNILGYSLQDIFITMRNGLVGTEGNGWDVISWESISSFVLAGGTLAAAGGTAAFLAVSDLGIGVLYLLLPALLVALVAVLVALVVLAARQAIIIVLVILSPLAFVAYLLPNTEKWFDKWRDLFITMLFLFPAFSVIFGGSQLAATAIIQTADSINLIILGMLVQVAPLFITPLLIKLGGGLLGRIAGLVNDPNKGLIDRTRKFVDDRTGNIRARRLDTVNRELKSHQFLRRNAVWRDGRRRQREGWKAANTLGADAAWANDPRAHKIEDAKHFAKDYKAAGEADASLHYERSRVTNPRVRALDTRNRMLNEQITTAKNRAEEQWENNTDERVLRTRIAAKVSAVDLEAAKSNVEAQLKEIMSGNTTKLEVRFSGIEGIENIAEVAKQSLVRSKAYADKSNNAEAQQRQVYAEALQNDPRLVEIAGGVLQHGDKKALASAKITIDNALEEAIKNIQNTSDVKAGDATGMAAELSKAIKDGDLATTVAYVNKLAESSNTGVNTLRNTLREHENDGSLGGDLLTSVKQFINANSGLNASAEDIGSWSRDVEKNRSLTDIVKDSGMWANMTPVAFASQKISSQYEALKNDGVDQSMAQEILKNNMARGSLKAPMLAEIKRIAEGHEPLIKSDPDAVDVNSEEE